MKKKEPTICIVLPHTNSFSETFLDAHIRQLPFNKEVLYLGSDNKIYNFKTGRVILPNLLQRIVYFKKSRNKKRCELAFIRYCKKKKIHLVLAEFGTTAVQVLEACKMINIQLVPHFHGVDAYNTNLITNYKPYYNDLFQYSKSIVVVSEDMRGQLKKLGANEKKIHIIPCGANSELFDKSTSNSKSNNLLAVGRFVDKKAPHLIILVFNEVLKKYPDMELVYIGEGPLLNSCISLAKALKIEDSIDFVGALNHQKVGDYMRKSIAFIQHSIIAEDGDSEGTPVSVMEAGMAGLPVVATRHAGIKDVVVDGETGFLVDELDINAMAKYIIALLEDKKLRIQLGEKAKEICKTKFSVEENVRKLAEIIKITCSRG